MTAVPTMAPVHEDVHQRTRDDKEPGEPLEEMGPVFDDQKQAGDCEQGDRAQTRPRAPKSE
jgi:hypothetical protein